MSQQQNSYVELPRIKRKSNSWEGKVIDYLLNHPSNRSATEFSIEAITAFWLAEALEGQVNQPELQKACWSAIEKLEAKLATIRRIAGIEKLHKDYSMVLASTTNVTTKSDNPTANPDEQPDQVDSDIDDDDEIMDLKLSGEMIQANKFFGMNP
ncbi:hypothetical protein H6G97_39570 [Nostoc flagelliforme FACHB-838]|uniref:Uncharacterized protein n=1 Tax=Nostoc flagelliforme FACHB-838 TaxID=2692904 RepID=A0ABR8E0B7_9NOSO|nr:hypothetical protein [Nostoc flagelliforme]MBD2535187.1 hypothetical protein [Nostoc flagelliforme FACHB-838]